MPTLREFEIVFDADGKPNGSLNEYHIGKIRQGDNLINRLKISFSSEVQPETVQLHATRSDGSQTPDTELMSALAGTDYFYYDLSGWFAEFAGQVRFNLSLSYEAVGEEVPELFTGTFILYVEPSTTSQGSFNLLFEPTLIDYLILNYYNKTQTEALFTNGSREYVVWDTTPAIDFDTLPAGSIYWNEANHTFAFKDDFGEELQINQQLGDIGKNYENLTLPEGTPVVFSGVQGNHKLFIRANANNENTSSLVGVVIRDTPHNGFSYCSVFGDLAINDFSEIIENYDPELIEFGTKLYLSATTAGKYSLTVPDRPNAGIWVATVTNFNENNDKGSIFIYPQRLRINGSGLDIQVSENQPSDQIEGDLWYDID
jgi:hypothetical protein